MKSLLFILLSGFFLLLGSTTAAKTTTFSEEGPSYDYSASIECKSAPDGPLYNGGVIKNLTLGTRGCRHFKIAMNSPAFTLSNLTGDTIYAFSSWVKISGANSASIKATLTTDNTTFVCVGTVIARSGCWSFLKGGFSLDSPSNYALISFQNLDDFQMNASVSSASLQPFTYQQWNANQQNMITTERKRAAILHVSDIDGKRLQGASVIVEQISRDFPFGSAIAETILGNFPYQNWFVERFNAAVFENELKWAATEPRQGEVNYTIPNQMLEFTRRHQITVRGHNIFWEDPKYTPPWVRTLPTPELKSAVSSRIQSLVSNYKNEFVHWDVNNEMLHWDFYEQRLGPNASLDFFLTVQGSDPLAHLFMNDFNVLETCDDMKSMVDHYVSRLQELGAAGVVMDGIGLEGHFSAPNPALIRAVLDKLALLNLPIWLTEVDISKKFDQEIQAKYLEVVLREGFSHPSVNGIMLWSALHPNGCYQMCLTDNTLKNLPAGDVVDALLKEWRTSGIKGKSDDHGTFDFVGFLGQYHVTVSYGNRTAHTTLSLSRGDETKHQNIQL
ncbi:endo-1,4-beta-xylanase 5-like [Salvia divinorum]